MIYNSKSIYMFSTQESMDHTMFLLDLKKPTATHLLQFILQKERRSLKKENYSPVLLVVSALRMNDLYVQKGCRASSGMYARHCIDLQGTAPLLIIKSCSFLSRKGLSSLMKHSHIFQVATFLLRFLPWVLSVHSCLHPQATTSYSLLSV